MVEADDKAWLDCDEVAKTKERETALRNSQLETKAARRKKRHLLDKFKRKGEILTTHVEDLAS